eukprot:TRINITY_DN16179_c0_g1_i1.p2 TRINITY_DN16179_c0_g1~~TRINITY_DN16179_c0_g1_i1.p2  ORF type:complete len:109 (+),score=33.90 TRINITY_DN16179_c0_g1_i1:38-364(+)
MASLIARKPATAALRVNGCPPHARLELEASTVVGGREFRFYHPIIVQHCIISCWSADNERSFSFSVFENGAPLSIPQDSRLAHFSWAARSQLDLPALVQAIADMHRAL